MLDAERRSERQRLATQALHRGQQDLLLHADMLQQSSAELRVRGAIDPLRIGRGALWKRVVFSDIREVDSAKHKAIPHQVRVDDLKTKRFSTIQIQKADASTSVSDGLFNEQSLSREI